MFHNYNFFKILTILFIFYFTNSSFLKANIIQDSIDPYCQGENANEFFKDRKIKNIKIITNKKKWAKNILRTFVNFNSEDSKFERQTNPITNQNIGWFNFRIDQKLKKKFKSTVIIDFDEKVSCKFKAKIRITGDLWYHIDWNNGNPITSLHVELLDGHINSITKFKLFLPKARFGKSEIFVASLVKEIGFLAPRTFMVEAEINGIVNEFIFQEDLRKEFLENLNLKEGPILEGDERFTTALKENDSIPSLALSRIANRNFSLKGETNEEIALFAVSNLNQIYLQHHQSKISTDDLLWMNRLFVNTEKFFTDKISKNAFQTFEALMFALDAGHNLAIHNRRFYFDPIKKYFLPIYYDGKSKIMIQSNENYFGNEVGHKLEDLYTKATIDAKIGAQKAIELINGIEHNTFEKKLHKFGINLPSKDYDKLIKRVLKRLEIIKVSNPEPVEFLKTKKYFSEFNSNIVKNRRLIFVNYIKKEFSLCSFNLDKCEVKKLIEFNNSLANILAQRFIISEKNLDNSENLFVYLDKNYDSKKIQDRDVWKVSNINNEFVLKYNKDIEANIDLQNKKITINQLSSAGRAIITGDKVEGWNIVFQGSKNLINKIPKDYLSLTGCLTLLDVKLTDIKLLSTNSSCEDSISIIRVKGNIKLVQVFDSISDALDIDFSNVSINYADIKNAGNDCLDLSYGNYQMDSIYLVKCGDKAVSVGERSNAVFKKINVNYSDIGLAAKDSSNVIIEKSEIAEVQTCFSAYRKKQEYAGAIVKVLQTNCKKDQFTYQEGSKIISNL